MGDSRRIELHIPSVLGAEKVAVKKAAELARGMGFSDDRVEDLKTAVAEACTNAIEHGNDLDAATMVGIVLTVGEDRLQIAVHDEGKDFGHAESPDIDRKIEEYASKRGWGRFLIESLTDSVTFEKRPDGGNVVKMVVFLDK